MNIVCLSIYVDLLVSFNVFCTFQSISFEFLLLYLFLSVLFFLVLLEMELFSLFSFWIVHC